MIYPDRSCSACGSSFQPRSTNQLHCSFLCASRTKATNRKGNRQERLAKRKLLEAIRPGSATSLEKL